MYHPMCKMLLAALLVALPGCSSTTKFIKVLPPQELLGDCPKVVELYKTNGDLVWTILEYRKALATCNIDKESLREWAKQ
jgi:hypothetical protein